MERVGDNESSDPLHFAGKNRKIPSILDVSDVKNIKRDSSGRYIVPRGMEKVRVPIWNWKKSYKIVGKSAPTLQILNHYLARNGNCQVYTGQTKKTYPPASGGSKRIKIWDPVLKQKFVGGIAPLESDIEAYLKKYPSREIYSGQDMITDKSGITKRDDSARGPVLLNLKSGKLMAGSQRPMKRKLSQYLDKNPHMVVYDSGNRHHQKFHREAKRARKRKRTKDRFAWLPSPRYPLGNESEMDDFESRRQRPAINEVELEAGLETMEFVGLDHKATSAVAAASENENNLESALETMEFGGLDNKATSVVAASENEEEVEAAVDTIELFGRGENAAPTVVASRESEYPNDELTREKLADFLGLNERKEALSSRGPVDLITDLEMDREDIS